MHDKSNKVTCRCARLWHFGGLERHNHVGVSTMSNLSTHCFDVFPQKMTLSMFLQSSHVPVVPGANVSVICEMSSHGIDNLHVYRLELFSIHNSIQSF